MPESLQRSSLGKRLFNVLCHVLVFLALGTLPIPWHEIVGHGLAGVLCGGKITRFHVYGLQFVPDFRWTGPIGGLGICDFTAISQRAQHFNDIAGSMSTFIVAVVAVFILWRYRPWGLKLTATLALTLWAMDLMTFTLPSFGTRRYIWSGTRYAEPYLGAVGLGIPGPVFQAFVVLSFLAVVVLVILGIRRIVTASTGNKSMKSKMSTS